MKALPRNCRTQSLRWKGRRTSGEDREARSPTRSTGTDRSVLATKARNGVPSEGIGSGALAIVATDNRRTTVNQPSKPFNIDKRGVRSISAGEIQWWRSRCRRSDD